VKQKRRHKHGITYRGLFPIKRDINAQKKKHFTFLREKKQQKSILSFNIGRIHENSFAQNY